MKPLTRPGQERVDAIAKMVAVVAVLLLVAAVAEAVSLENAPKPPPPTLAAPSGADLTATQAVLATASANGQAMALTLAAVMQVTPGAVVLGVSSQGTAPAPDGVEDFKTQNVWVGMVGDEWASVYAGALRTDPQTGALLLMTVRPDRVDRERFVLTASQGALHISAANDQRLTLVSAGGSIYYFDVLAGRFVSSLTEYAETATPSSATATLAATATATPTPSATPTPTETSKP